MSSPEWMLIVNEFESDGTLREILIHDTTVDDWDHVIDVFRFEGFRLEFKLADQTYELPAYAAEMFDSRVRGERYLIVTFADMVVMGCLESPAVIRFLIVPHAVQDWAHFESLVGFMRLIAETTEKDVVFARENRPDDVIFLVHPGEQPIEYIIDHG